MTPTRWSSNSAHGALIAGLLALLTASGGLSAAWPPPEDVRQQLESTLELLDRMEQHLPEVDPDLIGLAFALDFDYQAAVDHATALHFAPYAGVLRGPDGARVTGGGNHWDQALLLAALIKTMGGDAQVVGGTLADEDARRLLGQALAPVPDRESSQMPGPERLSVWLNEARPELAESLRARMRELEVPERARALDQRADDLAGELIRLLDAAGAAPAESGAAQALVNALATDYAWVRWRPGPGDEWREAHPAFGDLPAPEATPERYLADQVPEELQHRVAMRLYIERLSADGSGQYERVAIMSPFERPAAQLFKNQVSLSVGPLGGDEERGKVFSAPLLNGQSPRGALAFNELGLTVSASDATAAAAALFGTVSEDMAGAARGLNALGAKPDESEETERAAPRLTGVLLELDVIAPGGERSRIERRLADVRDRPDAPYPAATSVHLTLDIDIGAESPAELARRILDQQRELLRATPPLLAAARGHLTTDEARREPGMRALDDPRWHDFERVSDAMLPAPTDALAAYRPGPLIAARRTLLDEQDQVMTVSDVMHNPVTVLRRDAHGALQLAPRAALRQGVRETLLESVLMDESEGWAQRTPRRVIAGANALDGDQALADWPRAARERLRADLDLGYRVVLADSPQPHWWRVHPESGRTLGMGRHGGQAAAEYIVMTLGAGMSTYFFYRSVQSCDKTYKDNQKMADCCIVGNLAATYITAGAGAATGGLPTGEAAAWAAHPFAAGLGYVMASLQIEFASNMLNEAVLSKPIDSACRAYLDQ